MRKVGFIGLGHMGLPMARNLQSAGFPLCAFDVSADARDRADAAGLAVTVSLVELAQQVDAVFSMVPDGAALLNALAEASRHLPENAPWVDCSTMGVDDARRAHDIMGERFVDAPVSGGVSGAAAGTLTFIVGGNAETLDRVRPWMMAMGDKVVHCGGTGSGQAAKVCNNMLLAISMVGTCEAVAMGNKLGLDRQALFEVLSTSTGACWAVKSYYPVADVGPESPADRAFAPGFPSKMMVKDMTLTQKTAAIADQRTPLGARTLELYQNFAKDGGADTDFSGIISYLESLQEEQP